MRDIQGAEGATQSLNYVNDPIAKARGLDLY